MNEQLKIIIIGSDHLQNRYSHQNTQFLHQINEIVRGGREGKPNSEEIEFSDRYLELNEREQKEKAIDENDIPDYWSKAFKNCDLLSNLFTIFYLSFSYKFI